MKLVKKEPKKEQTIASFSDTWSNPKHNCGDKAGYGPNPSGPKGNYNNPANCG